MNCSSSANITPAAYPVGSPLTSGNPNAWNVGAGNFYSLNQEVVPTPESSTNNQVGGKKSKTRKHKKSKHRNIKRKHKKTHKKKKHARKHKKNHKKSHKKKHARKHKKTHKKRHARKHKKRTRRHRMRGGGRMPLLMPQSLVNGGRSLQAGLEGIFKGFEGKPQPVSPLPTNDQYKGQLKDVMVQKPINVKAIYQAAGQSAGSI